MPNKEYIGDSVYVEWEGTVLRLTAENGSGPSNEIFLEPEVWEALRRYVDNGDRIIAEWAPGES